MIQHKHIKLYIAQGEHWKLLRKRGDLKKPKSYLNKTEFLFCTSEDEMRTNTINVDDTIVFWHQQGTNSNIKHGRWKS